MSDIVILDVNAQKMFNRIMLIVASCCFNIFSFRELEWLHDVTPKDNLHWYTWNPFYFSLSCVGKFQIDQIFKFILTNVRTIPETQRRPPQSFLFAPDFAIGEEIALWLGIWSLTLPKTNSSHLKMMVSSTNLLFQGIIFRCNSLVSGKLFPLCRSWTVYSSKDDQEAYEVPNIAPLWDFQLSTSRTLNWLQDSSDFLVYTIYVFVFIWKKMIKFRRSPIDVRGNSFWDEGCLWGVFVPKSCMESKLIKIDGYCIWRPFLTLSWFLWVSNQDICFCYHMVSFHWNHIYNTVKSGNHYDQPSGNSANSFALRKAEVDTLKNLP